MEEAITSDSGYNSTNLSDIVYTDYLNSTGTIISGIFIFIFFVIGIVLNVFAICIIIRIKEYKNIFVCFLLSLCISDILSAVVSPLFWYRRTIGFHSWELSDFMCKFYFGMDMMTSCVTTLHILVFTLLRFLAVRRSNIFYRVNFKRALIIVFFLWVLCIGVVFIPFFIFNEAAERDRHSLDKDAKWTACSNSLYWYETYKIYVMVVFGILLYIPMIAIVALSIAIGVIVHNRLGRGSIAGSRKNSSQSNRTISKEKQVILQLVLVVSSFLIGYLPSAVYAIWTETHERYSAEYGALDYWLLIVCYILLRFSECLDPIFYSLGSTKIRRSSEKFLADKIPFCKKVIYKTGQVPSVTSGGINSKPETEFTAAEIRHNTAVV